MKCDVCGASLGMFKKYVSLSDGAICHKCFEELGFDKNDAALYSDATCSQIKSGYAHYTKMQKKALDDALDEHDLPTFAFAHYGEERETDATDEEAQMFSILCQMFEAHGYDPAQLTLLRKSDNYVSVCIGDYDLARMKYTTRAKWITFPYAEEKAVKHYIAIPEEITSYDTLLNAQLEHIKNRITLKIV